MHTTTKVTNEPESKKRKIATEGRKDAKLLEFREDMHSVIFDAWTKAGYIAMGKEIVYWHKKSAFSNPGDKKSIKSRMLKWYPRKPENLVRDLKKVSRVNLGSLYAKYCSTVKFILGKEQITSQLAYYYDRGRVLSDRRQEETEVLADADTENVFFTLRSGSKSSTLPKDLMEHIIGYVSKHNSALLNSIGLVCHDWFVLVLSTWRELRLRKQTLLKTPIVVFRALRVLKLGSDSWSDGDFLANEVVYITQNINGAAIRRIVLMHFEAATLGRLLNPLVRFGKGTKKNPVHGFPHLQEITFRKSFFGRPYLMALITEKQFKKLLKVRLSGLSANLTSVKGVALLSFVIGMHGLTTLCCQTLQDIESVNLNELNFRRLTHLSIALDAEGSAQNAFMKTAPNMKLIVPWIADMVRKDQLRILEVRQMSNDVWKCLSESLNGVEVQNMEKLVLHRKSNSDADNSDPLLMSISKCQTLMLLNSRVSDMETLMASAGKSLRVFVCHLFGQIGPLPTDVGTILNRFLHSARLEMCAFRYAGYFDVLFSRKLKFLEYRCRDSDGVLGLLSTLKVMQKDFTLSQIHISSDDDFDDFKELSASVMNEGYLQIQWCNQGTAWGPILSNTSRIRVSYEKGRSNRRTRRLIQDFLLWRNGLSWKGSGFVYG